MAETLSRHSLYLFVLLWFIWILSFVSPEARRRLQSPGSGECHRLGCFLPRRGVHLWRFYRAVVGLPHYPAVTGQEVSLNQFSLAAKAHCSHKKYGMIYSLWWHLFFYQDAHFNHLMFFHRFPCSNTYIFLLAARAVHQMRKPTQQPRPWICPCSTALSPLSHPWLLPSPKPKTRQAALLLLTSWLKVPGENRV